MTVYIVLHRYAHGDPIHVRRDGVSWMRDLGDHCEISVDGGSFMLVAETLEDLLALMQPSEHERGFG